MTSFIGIDMAWKINGNHSGVAVMIGDENEVTLKGVSVNVDTMAGVVDFVRPHAAVDTVIAIDASLVVKNESGQRPCEREIGRTFGRYHASCHTSNLGRPYAKTGMCLVGELRKLGFRHDFDLAQAKQRAGRWVFEVYPHPAMVRLFGLGKIIPYKKGSAVERRVGLDKLRCYLGDLGDGSRGLVMSAVLAELLARDLEQMRGVDLKKRRISPRGRTRSRAT